MNSHARGHFRRLRSGLLGGVVAIATMLAAPAAAQAVDLTVNDDGAGAGPAGADCADADHTTIQAGIDAADADDRVLVCAGTYLETPEIVDETTVIGNGPADTIIDGEDGTIPSVMGAKGSVDLKSPADVTFSGFRIINPANETGETITFAIFADAPDPGMGNPRPLYEISGNELIGEGTGAMDFGFYTDNSADELLFTGNTLSNQHLNPVGIEQHPGPATVSGNQITGSSAISAFSNGNVNVADYEFSDNQIDADGGIGMSIVGAFTVTTGGTFTGVEISGNTVENAGSAGALRLENNADGDGSDGEISDVTVAANRFLGGGSSGILLQGLVNAPELIGNTLVNHDDGILAAEGDNSPGVGPVGVDAHFNRIAGNANGLANDTGNPIDAENNWWGCNEGPNEDDCDTVTGGSVDFDPWLILGVSASPTTIAPGGDTSTITASLAQNSDGATPGGNEFPSGTEIDLATTLGTVTSPIETASPTATGTLTSGAQEGTAIVTASLDAEADSVGVVIAAAQAPVNCRGVSVVPTIGTSDNDNLVGDASSNAIFGRAGNDRLTGLGGDDCLGGDPGRDNLRGNAGTDVLGGGPGRDRLKGGRGADRLDGQGGRDKLKGQGGKDRLKGSGGKDKLKGQGGKDRLKGSGGKDKLNGGGAKDKLKGGAGKDRLRGGPAKDKLRGQGGKDRINAVDGKRDKVNCGGGDDRTTVDEEDQVAGNCEQVIVKD